MRATDISVGSLVLYRKVCHEPGRVGWIYLGSGNSYVVDLLYNDGKLKIKAKLEDCEPVPIKEEYLDLNGFERIDMGNGKTNHQITNSSGITFYIIQYRSGAFYVELSGNFIKISYLHKLQKLMYESKITETNYKRS